MNNKKSFLDKKEKNYVFEDGTILYEFTTNRMKKFEEYLDKTFNKHNKNKFKNNKIITENINVDMVSFVKNVLPIFTNLDFDGLTRSQIEDVMDKPDDDLTIIIALISAKIEEYINKSDNIIKSLEPAMEINNKLEEKEKEIEQFKKVVDEAKIKEVKDKINKIQNGKK